MVKLIAWTDLHNEFWDKVPDIPKCVLDADALLLAGDTSTNGRHIDVALNLYKQLRRPIIMVRGNHEFYGSTMEEIYKHEREKLSLLREYGVDIRILDGNSTIVSGTRIIGATLWTDMDLYPGYHMQSRKAVERVMNDFTQIRLSLDDRFNANVWLELHWREREAILKELSRPFDGPTVVMTHHMPVRAMIHPLRELGTTERWLPNAGFASDMAWDLKNYDIDVWLCGHSHDNRTATVQGLHKPFEIVSNARGYPQEKASFKPSFTINT